MGTHCRTAVFRLPDLGLFGSPCLFLDAVRQWQGNAQGSSCGGLGPEENGKMDGSWIHTWYIMVLQQT